MQVEPFVFIAAKMAGGTPLEDDLTGLALVQRLRDRGVARRGLVDWLCFFGFMVKKPGAEEGAQYEV